MGVGKVQIHDLDDLFLWHYAWLPTGDVLALRFDEFDTGVTDEQKQSSNADYEIIVDYEAVFRKLDSDMKWTETYLTSAQPHRVTVDEAVRHCKVSCLVALSEYFADTDAEHFLHCARCNALLLNGSEVYDSSSDVNRCAMCNWSLYGPFSPHSKADGSETEESEDTFESEEMEEEILSMKSEDIAMVVCVNSAANDDTLQTDVSAAEHSTNTDAQTVDESQSSATLH